MANRKNIVPSNIKGSLFVDTTCIDCDACRRLAPSSFKDEGKYSYVYKQPSSSREWLEALRALIACPVGSIGTDDKKYMKEAMESFPFKLREAQDESVFINGFNSKESFGADSYFLTSKEGNWLIDSPRFHKHLVEKFREAGGIDYIYLTHRDDVADASKYAKEFGAKRIIHIDDKDAEPESEIVIDLDKYTIGKAEIYWAPGHTKGHTVMLWDRKWLFTGDHFAYLKSLEMFGSFRNACWYSWETQINSVSLMEKFADVEHVFPGHGANGKVEKGTFPSIVQRAVSWMKCD